jgi:hypothetical protein
VTGSPPATLAEFTLLAAGGPDNYDISLVDGFNVPVGISTSKPCPAPSCAVDLNAECPAVLRVEGGCLSKCQVDARAGHPDNNPNCCSGTYGTPEMCPASGVEYYDYFKSRCKDAYAYAYDEGSQSALWTCSQDGGFADYTVTFCP